MTALQHAKSAAQVLRFFDAYQFSKSLAFLRILYYTVFTHKNTFSKEAPYVKS